LLLVAGCSDAEYPVVPVAGVVTLDGEPLAGGVINFQPVSTSKGSSGPGSSARIDDEGRYVLETIHGDRGAVVATHTVRIYSISGGTAALAPARDMDLAGSKKTVERVPARYNYQSTLSIDVPQAGLPTADFPLTTTAR
jgi:hypothetical protein